MKRFALFLMISGFACGQNPVPQPQTISALAGRAANGSYYLASSDASTGALLTGTGFGFAQAQIPQPQNALLMVGQCGSSPTKFCTVAVDPATGALLTSGGGGGGGATFPETPGFVYNTSTTASRNATVTDLNTLASGSGFVITHAATQFGPLNLTLNTVGNNDQSGISFQQNGTEFFQMNLNATDHGLDIFDDTRSGFALTILPNGDMSLMPNGGNINLGANASVSAAGAGAFVTSSASTSFSSPIYTGPSGQIQLMTSSANSLFFGVNNANAFQINTTGTSFMPISNLTKDLGASGDAFRNIYIGEVISQGTAPTIANGPAAGTSPGTPTVTGTNLSGVITVTTGTATTASAVLATVTFNGTLTAAPRSCLLQAQGINAVGQSTMVYTTAPTTTTWTLAVAGSPIPISTTYTWGYLCI